MATLNKEINIQLAIVKRIESLITNGKKTSTSRRTRGFYEKRITDLEKLWEDFSERDLKITEQSLDIDEEQLPAYIKENVFERLEEKCTDYLATLHDALREITTPPEAASSVLSSTRISPTTIVHHNANLPKIELPKFNGDYDKWRSFKDLFISLIDSDETLTNVEKLHYLKGCLEGEAEKLLRHTPITSEGYSPAWTKLESRYENKKILINHQLKILVNQPKQASESIKGIKALVDTTDECIKQLTMLDVDTSTWDVLLIHLLVQKLPFNTMKAWEEKQGGQSELPDLKQFSKFLETRVKVLESISDTISSNAQHLTSKEQRGNVHQRPVSKDTRFSRSFHTFQNYSCAACSQEHSTSKCPQYIQLDSFARYNVIKRGGRCFNCLAKHNATQCKSNFRCLTCKAKHHTSLHGHFAQSHQNQKPQDTPNQGVIHNTQTTKDHSITQSNLSTETTKTNMKPKSAKIATQNTSQQVPTTSSPTQTFMAVENQQTLLATAVVLAKGGKGDTTLRCLIDSGSQSSFITEAALKRLHKKGISTSVEISGLGSNQVTISRKQVKLTLRSRVDSTKCVEDTFLVLRRISDHLPTTPIQKGKWAQLTALPLADPNYNIPDKIEMLLGAKIFANILTDGIKVGTNTTPSAINTIFGWILMGSVSEQTTTPTTGATSTEKNTQCSQTMCAISPKRDTQGKCAISTRRDTQCNQSIEQSKCAISPRRDTQRNQSIEQLKCAISPRWDTQTNLSTEQAICIDSRNMTLDTQLRKFWEIEEITQPRILTDEDIQCEEIFHKTYTRLTNGTYQVTLPFKNNQPPSLGESKAQAIKRYNALQHKFKSNPELEQEYKKCLDEYIEMGHMEKADPRDTECYYIPHHAVFKESSTTKLRVVFDASAKTSNGKSLNEQLLVGPTLQPKLFATLLKWRKYRIAMNADIEKMYRMIEIHPKDRKYQRIIWRDPHTSQLQEYQLKTVTFGTSSAPYLAIKTLQQLATDEAKKWPLASKSVFSDYYVDDYLSSCDTIEEATDLKNEMMNMLKSANFNLRKWASNDERILAEIPVEHREMKDELAFDDKQAIKTLGLRWHPGPDAFSFKVARHCEPEKITKRHMLSEIASLYDPTGFISPIVIKAKILMQQLWILGSDWDTVVPDFIKAEWKTFIEDLPNIENIRIPRWVQYTNDCEAQIHGFCDASEKAYAAVLYLRTKQKDDTIQVKLLTSKTKVAPIKPTTIPRLELNAAVLLAKLIKDTVHDMKFTNLPIIAWTDSTIVLQWLKEHPSKWKTYVANRVVEIQDIIRFEHWRHISTHENPADIASRGIYAAQLKNNQLWWHGPEWLTQPLPQWPQHTPFTEKTELEAKQLKVKTFMLNTEDNFITRYSSYNKLIKTVAWIKRFTHNSRKKSKKIQGTLTVAEYRTAEHIIIKVVQKESFAQEYNALYTGQPLPKNSKLASLYPFMDRNGIIRVGGRLKNAKIPYSQKHPAILSQNHHITKILIDKIHQDTLHGGTTLVLNTSREKFWIIDARKCITSRLQKCTPCVIQRGIVNSQLMGHLPEDRVNISKPFMNVGVDFAGPILLKTSTLRNAKTQKAYICVFICMATKAIHIELVTELSSMAFLAALKRFTSRRGLCTNMYSDCGTNFIGTNTILNKEFRQAINQAADDLKPFLLAKQITWHFNPPGAPHFGGLWEAGVKSIKYHLKRVLANKICTYEEYATILAQIEACLNSRPLCKLQNDPDETFALTPGHFLIGRAINAIPEPINEGSISVSRRWKDAKEMYTQFCKKWQSDYLHQLQQRTKWQSEKPNLKIGDVVIVKIENTPPTIWPMGVITETYPDKNGSVRIMKIRTKKTDLTRPITKLILLPTAKAY